MDQRPRIFDAQARAVRQVRARRIGGDAFLAEAAREGIADRLAAVTRQFSARLDVAFDSDEVLRAPEQGADLAVSILDLHAINDLPGALVQIRRALKPDGLFLGALFGGASLQELRDSLATAEIQTSGGISPRVFPFADVRDMGGLLQRAGFALPVADVERTTILYKDFSSLIADLRVHGETNILAERRKTPLSRAALAAAKAHYAAHHADERGRFRATFEIIYLTGWSPHESQQKPLAPGSARTRLADALGTVEHSAGEKTPPKP
ncbi:MAG TPA: SAM-dependent methyltransferase [Rhizomicrobium sp.]